MAEQLYTPYGFRDWLFEDAEQKQLLHERLHSVFIKYGYRDVETPIVEYLQVFDKERGSVSPLDMYKFVDRDGEVLSLRPDMTPALARMGTFYFQKEDLPLRITSTGYTFRYNSRYSAKQRQLSQTGIEYYGDGRLEEDVEALTVAIEALKASEIETFRIAVGYAKLTEAILEALQVPKEERDEWLEQIESKNQTALEQKAQAMGVNENAWKLISILSDAGGIELIRQGETLSALLGWKPVQEGFQRIAQVAEQIAHNDLSTYVIYDPGMKAELGYYTGIIFKGYATGSGDTVLDGGRYDALLKQFGADWSAIGFGINQDSLMEAWKNQKNALKEKKAEEGWLTIALTKGRLATKTLKLLEGIGIRCDEMYTDTRKLVFEDPKMQVRFFLAKAGDVPTYVEYGAADIGVVGKDVLLEEKKDLYEVLDLGFGKCRMAVAGFPEGERLLQSRADFKVATKYPEIARQHFLKHHQMPEILKLGGSIELAPIVGLSDVIVDIVETGSTLKENGLMVLDTVCPVSARLVVNKASMKIQHERISMLIKDIAAIIKE